MTSSQMRTVKEGEKVTLIDHEGDTLGVIYITKIMHNRRVRIDAEPGIGIRVECAKPSCDSDRSTPAYQRAP